MSTLKDNSTIISQVSTGIAMSGGMGIGPNMISQTQIKPSITAGSSITNNGSIGGDYRNAVLEPINNRLAAIEERLAILTPDLQKLEKYTALKQAYDNYKLIETLCKEQP